MNPTELKIQFTKKNEILLFCVNNNPQAAATWLRMRGVIVPQGETNEQVIYNILVQQNYSAETLYNFVNFGVYDNTAKNYTGGGYQAVNIPSAGTTLGKEDKTKVWSTIIAGLVGGLSGVLSVLGQNNTTGGGKPKDEDTKPPSKFEAFLSEYGLLLAIGVLVIIIGLVFIFKKK